MKSSLLLFAAVILAAGTVSAQVSLGPELGVNVCAYAVQSAGGQTNLSQPKGGLRAGEKVNIPLTKHFSLQTGALYVRHEYYPTRAIETNSLIADAGNPTMKINTIEVPLNIVYKAKAEKVTSPFFSIGPYLDYNAWGSKTSSDIVTAMDVTYTSPLKTGSAAGDDIKTFDIGLGANAGLQLANGLYVMMYFQKGFVNLEPQGNYYNSMKNYDLGLSLGFFCHCRHMCGAKKEGK